MIYNSISRAARRSRISNVQKHSLKGGIVAVYLSMGIFKN
jgi:hypothetical protein